jgi:hypothetical protein
MSYIGPYTKDLLDEICSEINKEENKKMISNNIVTPLTSMIISHLRIYVVWFTLLQIIIILLLIYVVVK